MSRPAHFSDWHTDARQAALRESHDDTTGALQMAGRALLGAAGFGIAALIGALYADWVTGVDWTRDVILAALGLS